MNEKDLRQVVNNHPILSSTVGVGIPGIIKKIGVIPFMLNETTRTAWGESLADHWGANDKLNRLPVKRTNLKKPVKGRKFFNKGRTLGLLRGAADLGTGLYIYKKDNPNLVKDMLLSSAIGGTLAQPDTSKFIKLLGKYTKKHNAPKGLLRYYQSAGRVAPYATAALAGGVLSLLNKNRRTWYEKLKYKLSELYDRLKS